MPVYPGALWRIGCDTSSPGTRGFAGASSTGKACYYHYSKFHRGHPADTLFPLAYSRETLSSEAS